MVRWASDRSFQVVGGNGKFFRIIGMGVDFTT